jgi:hypothetical protein
VITVYLMFIILDSVYVPKSLCVIVITKRIILHYTEYVVLYPVTASSEFT